MGSFGEPNWYAKIAKKYLTTICLFVFAIVTVTAIYFALIEIKANRKTIVIDGTTYQAKQFRKREEPVQFLIIHSTEGYSEPSVSTLIGPNVRAHYVVSDTDPPHVHQLLSENSLPHHTGVSVWRNFTQLNSRSINIEIAKLGTLQRTSWSPFPEDQVNAVIQLTQQLVQRYGIKPQNVLGHQDIEFSRKDDPGPLFPWEKLHSNCPSLAAWYNRTLVNELESKVNLQDILSIQQKFKSYGYGIKKTGSLDAQTKQVVRAFQMHFRPTNYSGSLDRETVAILEALLQRYGST